MRIQVTMQKLKLIVLLVLVVLAIVLVLQNTEAVDTRLFFITVTMPRAVLLTLTLLTGYTSLSIKDWGHGAIKLPCPR
ncbi:hypothetical protein DDZ13_15165 [Coraliomargarita sinensis]|uniref:DUF1049 domain-containing protein n=1 Tax=Coraliomargarita sinensis TaxID=2174842 RepID=A0A317ZCG9_9BACT|nr:hypothetical protein DDZ13_15165 [Coraliomargarita sinensis]